MSSKSLLSVAAAAVMVAGGIAVPASAAPTPSPTQSASVEIPATPAGNQLRWVVDAISRAPIQESELKEHLTADFLAQVTTAGVNKLFQQLKGFTLTSVHSVSPTELSFVGAIGSAKFRGPLVVDASGKIGGIVFRPVLPPPTEPKSWSELDQRLAKVAPRTGFLVAEIKGHGTRTVHAVKQDTARPLGSMFKLYVLGAVAKQIRDGRLSWDTQLTITPELKSVPYGQLQDRPDGSKVTVFEAAKLMISISDNTGADLLLHTVGRRAVEKTALAWGAPAKGNVPFLKTREWAALKGAEYPKHAKAYLASDTRAKRAYLKNTIAKLPLTSIKGWPAPRELDTIEWFASPRDVGRAHAELRRFADPKIHAVMSAEPAGLPKGTWFKGGSEAGVINVGYSYQAKGKTFFITAMASNPAAVFDDEATFKELLALIKGAVKLSQ